MREAAAPSAVSVMDTVGGAVIMWGIIETGDIPQMSRYIKPSCTCIISKDRFRRPAGVGLEAAAV